MDRHIGPRFEIYAPAQAIPLDDLDRALSVSLTAVSADGLRMLAARELTAERMIVIEVEDHLLLAEVRNSQRDGSRYSIDAKRIHTLATKDLSRSATRLEKVRAVVDDFHSQLKARIALTPETGNRAGVSSMPRQGFGLESPAETQKKPVELVAPELGDEAALFRDDAEPGADRATGAEPEIPSPALMETFEPEPSITFHAIPKATEPVFPSTTIPGNPQKNSVAIFKALALQAPNSSSFESVVSPESSPERVEPDRLNELSEKEHRPVKPAAVFTGIVVVASVILLEAMLLGPFRVSANIIPPPKPAAAAAMARVSSAVPAPAIPAEPSKTRLATITATADTWISACSDGQMVFENLLSPNGTMDVRFSRLAVIRLGNAGGVDIAVDGKPIGSIGTSGMIRVLELRPDQIHLLPPNFRESPGDCKLP